MSMLFKKPSNPLEGQTSKPVKPGATDGVSELSTMCPRCKKLVENSGLTDNDHVCPYCRHHFRMSARRRLAFICDADTFEEMDSQLSAKNFLGFPEYDKKLRDAKIDSNEGEAVVTGTCEIEGQKTVIFVMEPYFMMGSMGSVVGEKITRAFEYAAEHKLPILGFTVSGGARMQEGILSLMQMAKTSGAVKRHSDEGGFYVCVITDPTTGGVTASFTMEADVILAEPFALIGFAGPRVIEQTIRKKLPEGFQRSEFLKERGFIDEIVDRKLQRKYIGQLLAMHKRRPTV